MRIKILLQTDQKKVVKTILVKVFTQLSLLKTRKAANYHHHVTLLVLGFSHHIRLFLQKISSVFCKPVKQLQICVQNKEKMTHFILCISMIIFTTRLVNYFTSQCFTYVGYDGLYDLLMFSQVRNLFGILVLH